MSYLLSSLTTAQLRQAADLKEKIEAVNKALAALLGAAAPESVTAPKKGKMSAAGRASIAAAQKARWAKVKAVKPPAAKKKTMSAAAKAKISAAAKARWAKAKATGKNSL